MAINSASDCRGLRAAVLVCKSYDVRFSANQSAVKMVEFQNLEFRSADREPLDLSVGALLTLARR